MPPHADLKARRKSMRRQKGKRGTTLSDWVKRRLFSAEKKKLFADDTTAQVI